ncbi:MAG TPA: LuxR C-terminal-related transcriptional regulator [Gaiellaceae bacterium]|jgi:PAS domain S-box-containing protein
MEDNPGSAGDLAEELSRLKIDLPAVLAAVPVPVYVISRNGTVRWLNRKALEVFGDRRGQHYSVLVAPEARQLVDEQFTRKILGTAQETSYEAVLLTRDGDRFYVDLDSVRVGDDAEAVAIFGLAEPERPATARRGRDVHLTPRQLEVLQLLAGGCSTAQMAERLHLSPQTVRNHVRGVLRALAVHSRLAAVSRGHELGLI